MNDADAAEGLNALGNESRLAIFRLLVQAGEQGLPIGRISSALGIPLSTLAHHLDRLTRASLLRREKAGREVHCIADYETLRSLTAYLNDRCCEGLAVDETEQPGMKANQMEIVEG